ncbi:hypothetical protein HNQ39_005284 [Armatimonas rosea]|uniref:Uncharacterized protein n=1 Tax=Armatimonas rosea TaxID=685828 RepID=A0A7W9W8E1_ARMRO|nr:hypothetical protein [Armatimonas rosea]
MEWTRTIAADGTWLCEHIDSQGNPAPASVLNIAALENVYHSPSNSRGELVCPGCGTLWRGWPKQRQVKFYIESPLGNVSPYQRAHRTDIDTLIAQVWKRFAGLQVTQYQYVWPADDDGIWWFRLPGITRQKDVQLETADGMLPFYVDQRKLTTMEEAVGRVCNLLKKIQATSQPHAGQSG